ncbi:MAG: septum formation initiator family protein [Alphaproteobacteria bacterium]|nr:septum formation initiator family protein [Alphaproteobacteria bacterium]
MNLVGEIRRRARHIVGPVLGITLFAYFAYHAVQGDRGLIAWWQLSQQVETAQARYDATLEKRQAFAHRVGLLRPDALDRDLVEERARLVLGMTHPDDVVILRPAGLVPAAAPEPKFEVEPMPPSPIRGLDRGALDDLIGDTLNR